MRHSDKHGVSTNPTKVFCLNFIWYSQHVALRDSNSIIRKQNFNTELINNSINRSCEWLMRITESFTLALKLEYLMLFSRMVAEWKALLE